MECSANHRSIEQRELNLSFERARITGNIRIVYGARFHLVACIEISIVARFGNAQKIAGV
jgi:hypothetical protein